MDYKKGFKLLTDPELFKFQNKQEKQTAREKEKAAKKAYKQAKANDFKGSYTKLFVENGLAYKAVGGKIDIHKAVQPYNKVDEIAAYHDICYDIGKNRGDRDKQMV